MRRKTCITLIIAAGLLLALPVVVPSRGDLLRYPVQRSIRILDQNGIVLREILSDNERISHYCILDSISPHLINATLISEDKRFFFHNGVDPLAIVRSVVQNMANQQVVSGASTITQQLARNLLNLPRRDIFSKCREAIFALILELKLCKLEILELYLNSAPYGNLARGVEAAARMYFDKPARDLTCDEAALLAVLPRAPSYYNPYRNLEHALNAQRELLYRMHRAGCIDSISLAEALGRPVHIIPHEQNFLAPHFCEFIRNSIDNDRGDIFAVKTTLDIEIQNAVEEIINNNLRRLKDANVTNAAVIVMELDAYQLRAYVGSHNFFDPVCGEVDGVQSLRQPGSAIKPFTYAIAIENGITPAELIADLPTFESTASGDYHPRNYDEKYHGLVRLRTALACSYNIPAVKILERIGVDELWRYLKRCGFNSLTRAPVHYGLGLTLGNGEVTLFELTRAFSIFAGNGLYRPVNYISSINNLDIIPTRMRSRIFKPAVAFIIRDILSDNNARGPAFGEFSPLNMPFFCAVKTGTSKDYRDNWCVGCSEGYVVGVWVGNFDGSPMNQVSGITGAAPIFRDIMLFLHRQTSPSSPAIPESVTVMDICALSGKIPGKDCDNIVSELFVKGNEPQQQCDHQLTILDHHRTEDFNFHESTAECDIRVIFPDNGDIYKIDPILRSEYQRLRLQIATTLDLNKVTWFIDGKEIGTALYPYSCDWPLVAGNHVITAVAIDEQENKTHADSVKILVLE